MKRMAVVLLLLACSTLISCSPAEPTHEFSISGVSPMVAKRAQAITIKGTGLGTTAGVLTIGGASADIISWSDTEVRASVAADAPHAWQDLFIEDASGKPTTVPRFFVGVEFAGEADELAAFVASLDADVALLLAAETYELPASDANLAFKRNRLYGHGQVETTIRTPGNLRWIADSGQDVVVADLIIEADGLEIASWLKLLADELDAGVLLEHLTVNAPTAGLNVDAMHGVQLTGSNLTATNIEIRATEGVINVDGNDLTAPGSINILAKRMTSGVGMITTNRMHVNGDDGPTLEINLGNGRA